MFIFVDIQHFHRPVVSCEERFVTDHLRTDEPCPEFFHRQSECRIAHTGHRREHNTVADLYIAYLKDISHPFPGLPSVGAPSYPVSDVSRPVQFQRGAPAQNSVYASPYAESKGHRVQAPNLRKAGCRCQ